jgi:hypothetical protein
MKALLRVAVVCNSPAACNGSDASIRGSPSKNSVSIRVPEVSNYPQSRAAWKGRHAPGQSVAWLFLAAGAWLRTPRPRRAMLAIALSRTSAQALGLAQRVPQAEGGA